MPAALAVALEAQHPHALERSVCCAVAALVAARDARRVAGPAGDELHDGDCHACHVSAPGAAAVLTAPAVDAAAAATTTTSAVSVPDAVHDARPAAAAAAAVTHACTPEKKY